MNEIDNEIYVQSIINTEMSKERERSFDGLQEYMLLCLLRSNHLWGLCNRYTRIYKPSYTHKHKHFVSILIQFCIQTVRKIFYQTQ